MRFAYVLFAVLVCSGALASEPGQRLDCSDWVFLAPGLSCRTVIEQCSQGPDGYVCQTRPTDRR
jgi:hypothetical protein